MGNTEQYCGIGARARCEPLGFGKVFEIGAQWTNINEFDTRLARGDQVFALNVTADTACIDLSVFGSQSSKGNQ